MTRSTHKLLAAGLAVLSASVALPAGAAAAPGPTGRYLVLFDRSERAAARAAIAAAGVERAGRGVDRLGIATVEGSRSDVARLRRSDAVGRVVPEYRRELRRTPNDPALAVQLPGAGVPPGTVAQWHYLRQQFPAAWDISTGSKAIVGVIDSGIDGAHPELAGKIASAAEFPPTTGATVDEEGHGTHVSGLACAATDDGVGVAGAGWGCRLAFVKTSLLRDEDVVNGIVETVDRGAHAVNMSFGGGPPSPAIDRAIDYALSRNVVLVAAASNDPDEEQGSPANQLQPGDAPDIDAGRGLVVTAADFADTRSGTGLGPQVSLAAYGFFAERAGPPGLLSTYPGNATARDSSCGCRASFDGDDRYAFLQGTSMAAPQVAAVAAMIGALNPRLTVQEKMRIIKGTAARAGGWTADRGWGILQAGPALDFARRVDRVAPESRAVSAARVRLRRTRSGRIAPTAVRVAWTSTDPPGGEGLLPSGIASYDVYVTYRGATRRIAANIAGTSLNYRVRRTGLYSFYTVAVDRDGNREAAPAAPDDATRVLPARR